MNRLIALVFLILLSPLFLIIALLIKLNSKGPVLFKQTRLSLQEKEFIIFKFRTMYDEKYITTSGKWLRKFKIDELPQLINILKGEMNFIGPRPTLELETELVDWRRKLKIYEVKPGLTCLALLLNLNANNGKQTAIWDKYYIKNKSLRLDLKIIVQTVLYIFKHHEP